MTQGGKRRIEHMLAPALFVIAGLAIVGSAVATDPVAVEEKQLKDKADDTDEPAQQAAPPPEADPRSSAVPPASVSISLTPTATGETPDRNGGWVLFTVAAAIAAGGGGFAAWWVRRSRRGSAGAGAADSQRISTRSRKPPHRRV